MPGVNFGLLREQVDIRRVLEAIGFEPVSRRGCQWRGPCPVHGTESSRSRVFSVNLAAGRYCCHKCGSRGNQLELWAAVHQMPLYDAAIHLCRTLGHDVPWVRRW